MKGALGSNLRDRLRRAGLTVSLLAGTAVFARQVDQHYPISKWLFWSYLEYWLLCSVFTLACWGAGDTVVRALVPGLRASERIVFALCSGLLVFVLGMFLGGLLGLLGSVFFISLPLLMILGGGQGFCRFLWRLYVHGVGAFRRRKARLVAIVASVFGLGGIAMVYFAVLTPDNIAYDARWYHLAIAEHYAAQGAIRAFPEGWYPGALPHLASLVYTWAFLLPGSDLFDRVELSAHLEVVIFLWTLGAIPVLVRSCVRPGLEAIARSKGRVRGEPRASGLSAWASLFLFPGIFLYDSSLSGAADHVNAFWAGPILLALFCFFRRPGPRAGALLAMPMSGALLTKYQASSIVAFPILAFVVYVLWGSLLGRARVPRRRVLLGGVAVALVGAALTSPHWLKNWIWYGDPVYPFLHRHLQVHPWTVDSGNLFDQLFVGQTEWLPQGTTQQKLLEALDAVPTFSFRPHDWWGMHQTVPVFGSLFTLSLIPLLFFRRSWRVWLVAAAANAGVFVWYWTFHQDRYLQCLVPWMAVVVSAVCVLVWESGSAARASLVLLVGVQVVWGGDVYFIPTHSMLHKAPAKAVVELMSRGFRRQWTQRRQIYGAMSLIGEQLRPGSKVLLHDSHMHLGLGAMSVSDCGPWQGGISYGRNRSPGTVYDQLHGYGVTHLIWDEDREYDSLAGDFVFYAFATQYARPTKSVGGIKVAVMPRERPAERAWLLEMAAVYLCPGKYEPGQYQLGDLTVPGVGPATYPTPQKRAEDKAGVDDIVRASKFLALEPSCHPEVGAAGYVLVQSRGKTQLWIKGAP